MTTYVQALKKRIAAAKLPRAAKRELLAIIDERVAREMLVLDDEHGVFKDGSPAIQLLALCAAQRQLHEDFKLLMEFFNSKVSRRRNEE